MNNFLCKVEIRWSDLDPNFHVRHSAYYDFGAFARIKFFYENGVTPEVMLQHNVGPILFREECIFKKEIKFGDVLTINLKLDKSNADFSRWTIVHEIFKNDDVLAAVLSVDGAWIDTIKRKLAVPPDIFTTTFYNIVRTDNFRIQ